jgi:hypothetical protein
MDMSYGEIDQIRKDLNETARILKDRILALIPAHPEILTIDEPWGLFQIPGFDCRDLQPSCAQAGWAFGRAKAEYRARKRIDEEDRP